MVAQFIYNTILEQLLNFHKKLLFLLTNNSLVLGYAVRLWKCYYCSEQK